METFHKSGIIQIWYKVGNTAKSCVLFEGHNFRGCAYKYIIVKILFYCFNIAGTQFRSVDVHKHAVKSDRKIKEMEFTTEENRKNIDRMSELVDKLQNKIRT